MSLILAGSISLDLGVVYVKAFISKGPSAWSLVRLELSDSFIVDYARVTHNDPLHHQVLVFLHKFKYVEIALSTGNIKNPPNTSVRGFEMLHARPIHGFLIYRM